MVIEQDLKPFIEARITPDFFPDDKHRKVFEMVLDHYRQHSKPPTEAIVLAAYPTYKFRATTEPTLFYLTELQESRKLTNLMSVLKDVADQMNDPAVDLNGSGVETLMRAGLAKVLHEIPHGILKDFYGTVQDHRDVLDDRMANPGALRGISTGFRTLDFVTGGLQPQQLITLVGLPKGGKSSVLLSLAKAASLQGQTVLFFTFEMTVQEQNDRLYSLLSGVDLNKILFGTLTVPERQLIDRQLVKYQGLAGKLIFAHSGGGATISSVQSRIAEVKPDVVFIDGVYLMEDESNPPEPPGSARALTNLTRGFKRMCQAQRLPIVISTQALFARAKGGIEMGSIGYSSSFAQDSDTILAVEGTEHPNVSKFRVIGQRSGPRRDMWLQVDWTKGALVELSEADATNLINGAANQTKYQAAQAALSPSPASPAHTGTVPKAQRSRGARAAS